MNFSRSILLFLFLLGSNYSIAQVETNGEVLRPPLFTKAESAYIDQWFADFVQEMNLSDEVALEYQDISNKYSTMMDDIGIDKPNITKAEIVEQFNTLMEGQHEEVQSILTDEQYEMYHDTMEKVVWSINRRLNQL